MRALTRVARLLYDRTPWVLSMLPAVVLWEIIGRMHLFLFLPPASQVLTAAEKLFREGRIYREGLATLGELLLGLALAIVAGVVLGTLMGRFRRVEWLFDLYVNLFMSVPMAAFVPVMILVFGLNRGSIVATVFIFTFFLITVNAYTGVRNVDPRVLEMARSFGAPEHEVLRRIVLPSAMPLILTGIRLGVGRAFNGAVLGEMLISVVGIGGMIMFYGGAFQMDFLLALILIVALLAASGIGAVEWLEYRVLRWLPHS